MQKRFVFDFNKFNLINILRYHVIKKSTRNNIKDVYIYYYNIFNIDDIILFLKLKSLRFIKNYLTFFRVKKVR